MTAQLTMDFSAPPSCRATDPRTSADAAKSASIRSGSQRAIILKVYADQPFGLTDEEAGDISGLSENRKCCYWKRCSELRQMGFITPTGQHRKSSANENQMVCVITNNGRRVLSQIETN
jgi:hypothetical protein